MTAIEVSIVTEAFNLTEGQSAAALAKTVAVLLAITDGHADREVLFMDPSGDPEVRSRVPERFRWIDGTGLGYDAQKTLGAQQARGRYVAYLDGDCEPAYEDWLECLLAPLRADTAEAVTGITIYDDVSNIGIANTIIDFGYLWDNVGGVVGCYAGNNAAFVRELRCEIPPPEGRLRCECYSHTQLLAAHGIAIRCVSEALVLHALPDLAKERWRRGYDLAGACWSNPRLPETVWLAPGENNVRGLIEYHLRSDLFHLLNAPEILDVNDANRDAIWNEILKLRAMDAGGLSVALDEGERNGWNASARLRTNEPLYGGQDTVNVRSAVDGEVQLGRSFQDFA